MRGRLAIVAGGALLTVVFGAGCQVTTAGKVVPAADLVPTPITGETIKQVLPDAEQLFEILHVNFDADPEYPPKFGTVDDMPDGLFANPRNNPRECLGVVGIAKTNYADTSTTDFTSSTWFAPYSSNAGYVGTSVVALETVADANTLYKTFSDQWVACDRQTANIFTIDQTGDTPAFTYRMTDTQAGDSTTTMTVQLTGDNGLRSVSKRVLTVRVNCLIETEVGYDRDPDSGAADLANLMSDKVGELAAR